MEEATLPSPNEEGDMIADLLMALVVGVLTGNGASADPNGLRVR